MKGYLRVLGTLLLVGGTVVCLMGISLTLGDETYYRKAMALERHEDHILFQAEYQAALLRHTAYIVTAVVSGLLATVGSVVLFALASILGRLERERPAGH
jgi:hypothetical protein